MEGMLAALSQTLHGRIASSSERSAFVLWPSVDYEGDA